MPRNNPYWIITILAWVTMTGATVVSLNKYGPHTDFTLLFAVVTVVMWAFHAGMEGYLAPRHWWEISLEEIDENLDTGEVTTDVYTIKLPWILPRCIVGRIALVGGFFHKLKKELKKVN
ncbi:MAG: hypothetical protein PHD63_05740 [Candidatus Marinimicrobia bacterium]|jgi:hypothetical protein|nr:hypothetical protein [Candidatus Neomarinimicrobiota bacterium]MDD3967052.1 hypothetical protein [Candidatus Neomarinimicrobiota bacterium]